MTKAPVLALAFNLVNFTGDLDDKGQPVQRSSYPKANYSGFVSLKKKLLKAISVTAEGDKTYTLDEFQSIEGEKPKVVREQFNDSEVDLSEQEKKALKAAYDSHDHLPIADEETMSEFASWSGIEVR
jgi:hypothetical protein